MNNTLLIALGGALGSMGRYWFGILALPISRSLPVGTILINIIGSFVIGFFGTLTLENGRHPVPESVRLLIMVGICGGFTTFSSFSLQTLDLMRGGGWNRALVNVGASVLLCLAAVAAGHALASHWNGGARQVTENVVEEEAS